MNITKKLTTALLILLLSACSTHDLTGTGYTYSDARRSQAVSYGSIINLTNVRIEPRTTAVGPASGAAIGAILTSDINNPTTRRVAQVIGGVAGGATGNYVERKITTKPGVEIVVKLSDGQIKSIVQESTKNTRFQIGDNVRIVQLSGQYRVIRL